MKKGDKVKTWISNEIATVIKVNTRTKEVTVKFRGQKWDAVMPELMCQKV